MNYQDIYLVCKIAELANANWNFFAMCCNSVARSKDNQDAIDVLVNIKLNNHLSQDELTILNRIILLLNKN